MQRREPWTVQETKLIPPTRPGGLIERRSLLDAAIAGAAGRLLLVVAAAGFGKSSLLAGLHRELSAQGHAVGWISLDAADNDHARFLSHLVEAIRPHDARFGTVITTLLRSGAPLPAANLRSGLLNELAAFDRPIHVFLDDYHLIGDADVRETVNALLAAPLPRLHLVIASRTRNHLPLGRLRAQGELREIAGAALAFSVDETRDFLSLACRRPLEPAQVAALHARTEGWAASLQLASIAIDSMPDVHRFMDGFSGQTRNIGEFLGEEVLRRQRPELQDFLLDVSILQRFNSALAQRVTGHADARALIDEIESRNLFVYSLDDRRNWYRFHHLFVDFLRRHLQDHDPQRVPRLHRRAAQALEAEGLAAEAIEHAFLAGDPMRAGRLLDAACVTLFATGQVATLQQQAARIPPGQRRRLPRLQLELSWDDGIQWRFADAAATLQNVAEALADDEAATTMAPADRTLLESKLVHRQMMVELFSDRRAQALALCERWRASHRVDDFFMQASVGSAMMLIARERHDCEAVAARAEALRAQYLAGGAIYGTIFHDSAAGTTLFMRGEIDEAQALLGRARQTAIELAGPAASVTAMPTALLAEVCYERGELSRARDLLAEHASSSAAFGFVDQTIARFVTAARLSFAAGQPDDADSALEAGLFIAAEHGFERLRAHLIAERIRQMALSERGREVAALLLRHPLPSWPGAPMPGEAADSTQAMTALAWCRLSILRGEAARTLPVLRRWITEMRPGRALRTALRMQVLLAHAHAVAGDPNAALRNLREALGLLPRGGFVRSFLDEGPVVIELLEALRVGLSDSDAALRGVLADILDRAGSLRRVPAARTPEAPEEKLAPRELEILRLSAAGMATCDIARAVQLSENTVKWYWQRIFAKLGVHRRFDAVTIARERRWMD